LAKANASSSVSGDFRFAQYRHRNYFQNAGWSSLVARQAHNLKVAGSNPAPATKFSSAEFSGSKRFASFPVRRVNNAVKTDCALKTPPFVPCNAAIGNFCNDFADAVFKKRKNPKKSLRTLIISTSIFNPLTVPMLAWLCRQFGNWPRGSY
jgi:hypothetical protein